MTRLLTARNVIDKKITDRHRIAHEIIAKAIGDAERKGCWLIYGFEKNGKTWFTLILAKALAVFEKVVYISAEEGTDFSFQMACERAGISASDNIVFSEYLSPDEIIEKFSKPKTPNIIIIDNLMIYRGKLKTDNLFEFVNKMPNKLIIFVAHEKRNEAYPAVAEEAKRMAKVIIYIKGLRAFVTSRFSKGGTIDINDEKSEMYWGDSTSSSTN